MLKLAVLILTVIFVAGVSPLTFPDDFKFGVASAAYQIEGGWDANGKGESIWDRLTHEHPDWIKDQSNGDVACDSYNNWREDVQILKELGVDFYRFSLSWSRIMPWGATNVVNQDGIRYYNDLINELLANNIEPMVTLYHWDLPQALQDIGGFLNEEIAQFFVEYADIAFQSFGDRVKKWITFNEPMEVCRSGYSHGWFAPAYHADGIGGYICGRTLFLAHAKAYHLYNDTYRPLQNGTIGITLNSDFSYPKTNDSLDVEAAQRNILMQLGWWAHPIYSVEGDYPQIMRDRINNISMLEGYSHSRLPPFSPEEVAFIRGTADFFGLNHYTSVLASHAEIVIASATSHWKDVGVNVEADPSWPETALPWLRVHGPGLRKLLGWIKDTYNNPPLYITENGFVDLGELDDLGRVDYLSQYLNATLEAVQLDGCNVKAYTAWSIMDNMEWREGYTVKFGLYQVDFNNPSRPRTPKASAAFYNSVIANRTIPGRR